MIALWILLGILALIILLLGAGLMLPVDLLFLLDSSAGFRIRYRFSDFSVSTYRHTPSPEEIEKSPRFDRFDGANDIL